MYEELGKRIKEALEQDKISRELINVLRINLTDSNDKLDIVAISKFEADTGMKLRYRKVHDLEHEMFAVAVVYNDNAIEFVTI